MANIYDSIAHTVVKEAILRNRRSVQDRSSWHCYFCGDRMKLLEGYIQHTYWIHHP